jgi:hypothetical protein
MNQVEQQARRRTELTAGKKFDAVRLALAALVY